MEDGWSIEAWLADFLKTKIERKPGQKDKEKDEESRQKKSE